MLIGAVCLCVYIPALRETEFGGNDDDQLTENLLEQNLAVH